MSDNQDVLAALSAWRSEQVGQQVALQRAVDRIANDHVELRQGFRALVQRVDTIETKLDTRVKHSDHVHSSASEVDAKHESDMAAVIVAVEGVRKELSATTLENRRQSALLELIRGPSFKRLVNETTRLVTLLAAVVAAYLAAKGHK